MRFVTGLPVGRSDGAFTDPAVVAEVAGFAEEAGFWGFTAPDHVVSPGAWARSGGGEEWPDPFVMLAYVAALTERLRLITHVVVLPYRSPLVVAKAVGSLDRLSGGRAVLGVGAGYVRGEFKILGVPFDDRGARTDEYLRAIRACWTDGDIAFDGEFVRVHDARMGPQPVQPAVPVWVGGNSARAFRRAVELGDCWAPFDVADPDVAALRARASRRVELAMPLPRISRARETEVRARLDELRALDTDIVKCSFAADSPAEWLAEARWFAAAVVAAERP